MGEGFVDNLDSPTCGQILLGDFSFVAGDYNSSSATSLITNIPENRSSQSILIIPQNERWEKLIEECYPSYYEKITRYAFKNDTDFSLDTLYSNINKLNDEFQLIRIDKNVYQTNLNNSILNDLYSQFPSFDYYSNHGIGFCILHNQKIVSCAYSYLFYNKGIEIQIDTDEKYRNRGLGSICASRLMIECILYGKHPGWDAADKRSCNLALKLGYEFSHEYTAYEITVSK